MPSSDFNEFGQEVGPIVPNWTPCERLPETPMVGRYCTLYAFDALKHAEPLFRCFSEDDGRMWTYMSRGPFTSADKISEWIKDLASSSGIQTFVICKKSANLATGEILEEPLGSAGYMRHNLGFGVVEVGWVAFSPRLRRSAVATEAMYLMMKRVFEAGFRRYEWKCHNMNAASKAAALRFGFQFEGIFRQDVIVRGRSRDTAWFSILHQEFPLVEKSFEAWLSPDNFDDDGKQKRSLSSIREELSAQVDAST